MNIAAIYDKYDLWGKVRIESKQEFYLLYRCRILDDEYPISRTADTLYEAIRIALKDYISCLDCEGTGVVPAKPYTSNGNIPDCDIVKCETCNGTGERKGDKEDFSHYQRWAETGRYGG